MPDSDDVLGAVLGFTVAWFELGIVDQSFLKWARARWNEGEDHNTEHYRFKAFGEFVEARRPLSAQLAAALYDLGAADADPGMGGAMMAGIVYLPECPESVLAIAAESGQRHLVRAVERRRA